MNYATITQVKQLYRRNLQTDTSEDAMFAEFLDWASRFVEWYKDRRFDVRQETLLFDAPIQRTSMIGLYDDTTLFGRQAVRPQALILDEDLLQVIEILNGNGEELTSYVLEPGRTFPKRSIRLRPNEIWQSLSDGSFEQAISISGIWGYAPNYTSGSFVDTGEELSSTITTGTTTILIEDLSQPAKDGKSPRIQAGNLLRFVHTDPNDIVHTEFVLVLSTTVGTGSQDDEIEVLRGYNGTTAYAFPSGTKLEVFRPWSPISQSVLRLTQWRYSQKDSGEFDKQYFANTGILTVPANLPSDVLVTLGPRGKPRL